MWREDVKKKISLNHVDVSGENHPMYGNRGELSPLFGRTSPMKGKKKRLESILRGKDAPGYIDGRNSFKGETYRRILLASGRTPVCHCCGATEIEKMPVHHVDGNMKNNDLINLMWVCRVCHLNTEHRYVRDNNGRFIYSVLSNSEGGKLWV